MGNIGKTTKNVGNGLYGAGESLVGQAKGVPNMLSHLDTSNSAVGQGYRGFMQYYPGFQVARGVANQFGAGDKLGMFGDPHYGKEQKVHRAQEAQSRAAAMRARQYALASGLSGGAQVGGEVGAYNQSQAGFAAQNAQLQSQQNSNNMQSIGAILQLLALMG